ncbi:hypothetical protein, partial [Mesorhizobium sp.]|uniref:hypothetical protein n=1 Tax=Mesorhizobium sp. TaxID=1871066 RepID=UPI00257F0FD4
ADIFGVNNAPALADQHKSRLYNVTDGAVAAVGTADYASNGAGITVTSIGACPVVAGKAYRVEHRCTST